MCYGSRVEDPGKICGVPASVRGSLAWIFFLGVLGWFIYVCTQNRDLFPQAWRVGFLAGVWSLTALVMVFACSYSLYPGRVAGDDTLHAVVNHATTSRIEGNYEIRTHHTWCAIGYSDRTRTSLRAIPFILLHDWVSWESGLARRRGLITAALLLAVVFAGIFTYLIQKSAPAATWEECQNTELSKCSNLPACMQISINGATVCAPKCIAFPDDNQVDCMSRSDCSYCTLRPSLTPAQLNMPPSALGGGTGCYFKYSEPSYVYYNCTS